jgi:hypothetical protein
LELLFTVLVISAKIPGDFNVTDSPSFETYNMNDQERNGDHFRIK